MELTQWLQLIQEVVQQQHFKRCESDRRQAWPRFHFGPHRYGLVPTSVLAGVKSRTRRAESVMSPLNRVQNILLERRRYWLVPIAAMLIVAVVLFLFSAGGRLASAIYLMF